MRIKKLVKELEKIVKEQYNQNAYLRVDTISINLIETPSIIIKGAYGIQNGNEVLFQKDIILQYPLNSKIEFIKGMFYQYITTEGE